MAAKPIESSLPSSGSNQSVDASKREAGAGTRQLWLGCVLLAASILLPDALGNIYWTHVFQLIGLYIIASIAQNLLLSDAGQASFGQGAVFGVAAYVTAMATSMHGVSLAVAIPMGIGAALLVGLLFALPALRVQHFYLGFVTLSAAVVLPEMALALSHYTNGVTGISTAFPALHARSLAGEVSPLSAIIVILGIVVLVAYWRLRQSRLGRSMRVAAESSEAAQSLGISPGAMRFTAFLIAAVGTGAAGTLYPVVVGFVSPTSFSLELSMLFFFSVIVGGRGTLLGPILGIWVLYLLPNVLLAEFVQFRLLAYGVATLFVVLCFPDGIVGAFERWSHRRKEVGKRLALHVDAVMGSRSPSTASASVGSGVKQDDVAVVVRNGRKTFGSVIAVDGVDLTVRRSEIHGLVGANGSGKTSLLNILSGFSSLDAGSMHIDGKDTSRLPAHRIAKLGLGRTFQTPRIFPTLTLWENVQIGLDAHPGESVPQASAQVLDRLRQTLGDGSPSWVPHGQRRLIEVLRVALKEPSILLLDEPAAGLSPDERKEFAVLLRQLRDQAGKTIVLVEHDLDFVWGICDSITVLDAGKVVATGTPTEVAANPSVNHMFIQGQHA